MNQADEHWKENQPQMYQRLKESGQLQASLQQAAQQTAAELEELVGQGVPRDQAWEQVREKYLFPPEEEGASPEPETSGAFSAAQDVNRMMGSLSDPEEPESPQATSPRRNSNPPTSPSAPTSL
jgi:hypothetical protein